MKPKSNPFLRSASLAASIVLCFDATAFAGTTLYWDSDGTGASGNPPTSGVAGSGTVNWDLTNARWWDGSAYQLWSAGSIAVFGGTDGTTTVSTSTSADGLVWNNSQTLASSGGAVLTLNNVANNINFNTRTPTISATLAGYLNFTGATGTSGPIISGTNTGVLATKVGLTSGANYVRINNASALGSASATVQITSGALGLENVTSGVGISYNAWATDLAGGAIRVRNGTGGGISTWNGAISLSANSAISVRAAAGVGLNVANTVNLNGNTLTVGAGTGSSGVDFQSEISGAGSLTLASTSYDAITSGNAVVKLSAANTFSGTATTTKDIATLALNHVDALQNATLDTGASGTQAVTFTAAGTTYNIGALAGSDALDIGGNTISVGVKAADTSFNADISGASGGLTKVGSNKLTLTAGTSYSGATQITGGTLLLSSAGAINSTSGITINGATAKFVQTGSVASTPAITLTNGTLDGTGTVGNVTVADLAGNTVAAGNGGTGTLTTGNLTFNGAAAVNLLNGSTLTVGTLAFNGTGPVTVTAGKSTWTAGSANKLIGYTSFNGTNFSNLALSGGTVTGMTSNQRALGLVNNTGASEIDVQIAGNKSGIINWGTPTLITNPTAATADANVLNLGAANYAYTESNAAATVNGVAFTAGNSSTTLGGGNVTMSGFSGVDTANFSNPTDLGTEYSKLTKGGAYNSGAAATITLNNLTANHVYAAQVWANDSRVSSNTRTETVTSTGGNTVTLNYANSASAGASGQFTIGGFTAGGTTQAFTMDGNVSTQLNAIQVRDVTGVWSGGSNGSWDAGINSTNLNWTGSNNFDMAKGLVSAAYFGDTDGFGNAITNSAVTIATGGVSIGTVNFMNNSVNYTLNSADTNGITGSTALTKSGTGTLTLSGANTYTGTTTAGAGVLLLSSASALPGGIGSTGGTSGLTLNGGVIGLGNGDFTRGLGTGTTQVQWTGSGGFAAYTADRSVNLGGASAGVTWNSGSFVPTSSSLILGASGADKTVDFQNAINLNDATRTVQVDDGSATVDAVLSGVISSTTAASGGLTKTGAGTLKLANTNTYTGKTTISAGTLILGHATDTIANTGAIDITAGTLDFGANSDSVGIITMTGGTLTGSSGTLTTPRVNVNSTTTAAMTGGNIQSGQFDVSTYRGLIVGSGNTATFTISGGTFTSLGGNNCATFDILGTTAAAVMARWSLTVAVMSTPPTPERSTLAMAVVAAS